MTSCTRQQVRSTCSEEGTSAQATTWHLARALLSLLELGLFVCSRGLPFLSTHTHHRTRGGGRGPWAYVHVQPFHYFTNGIVISVHHSIGARFIFRLSFEKKKKRKKRKKEKRMAVVS
jgi:hypothetical protein